MSRPVKILIGALGVFFGLVLVAFGIGFFTPEKHTEVLELEFTQPVPIVWNTITDYDSMPRWWPAVKGVRKEIRAQDGKPIWWNTDKYGEAIPFETKEERPPNYLVRMVAADNLPFGGSWIFQLDRTEAGGTHLVVTEEGFVRKPIYRFMAKYVFGYRSTLEDFGKSLQKEIATR